MILHGPVSSDALDARCGLRLMFWRATKAVGLRLALFHCWQLSLAGLSRDELGSGITSGGT